MPWRRSLEKGGMTVTSTRSGVVHVHPLIKVEQAERALFVKLAKLLGLHWTDYVDGGEAWGEPGPSDRPRGRRAHVLVLAPETSPLCISSTRDRVAGGASDTVRTGISDTKSGSGRSSRSLPQGVRLRSDLRRVRRWLRRQRR